MGAQAFEVNLTGIEDRSDCPPKPAPSPRRPTSTASRWWTTTASSTPTSWIARAPNSRRPGTRSRTSRASSRRRTRRSRRPTRTRPTPWSAWTCAPNPSCSPCRRSKRSAISASSSSIAYTFNFDYIGSRTTGNDGGSFLVAGPGWKGETPKGVKKVFRSETEFVLRRLSHAAFQSGRHRQREEGAGRLQGADRSRRFSASLRPRPRRRLISSSRSRPPKRRPRWSSSTS